MISRMSEWWKSHHAAVLGTIVILQNLHVLGTKGDAVLEIVSRMFSAMGGT